MHLAAFVSITFASEAQIIHDRLTSSFGQLELGEIVRLIGPSLSAIAFASVILILVQSVLGGICANFGELRDAFIHWRWPSPLPGRRAFTVIGFSSSRVDLAELEGRFGQIPKGPREQNQLFTKVYSLVKDQPSVLESHQQYLLMREVALVTLWAAVTLPIAVALLGHSALYAWTYAGLLWLLFLIFAFSAQGYGRRLVENVLAEASSHAYRSALDTPPTSFAPSGSAG
jgi:hypothetical protein